MKNITLFIIVFVHLIYSKTHQYPQGWDELQNNQNWKLIKETDRIKIFSKKISRSLIDETQEIAKKYDTVCTPDFFGYNNNLELQYRGRIRELKDLKPVRSGESDLLKAMKLVAQTGKGPENQTPSMGCSIKWFK